MGARQGASMLNFFRSVASALGFKGPVPDTRHLVLDGLNLSSKTVLEIGPLARPIVARNAARQVFYMDHCSTEDLRKKYQDERSLNVADIAEVDFVAADGRISNNVGSRKFDVIVASHVIEHVPDLIGWIEEASSVLTSNGVLALIVPDKRYTFDVCRRLSPHREIEAAYRERRTRPGLWNVVDHFANVVSARADDLWRAPETALEAAPIHSPDDVERALTDWKNGGYIDCHAWVFTPEHFNGIMTWANEKCGLPVTVKKIIDTKFRNLEFYVQLQQNN